MIAVDVMLDVDEVAAVNVEVDVDAVDVEE